MVLLFLFCDNVTVLLKLNYNLTKIRKRFPHVCTNNTYARILIPGKGKNGKLYLG